MFLDQSMCIEGFEGFHVLSMINPSMSCQGYCLTPHVH